MGTCAQATEDFLDIYEKWKSDYDLWEIELAEAQKNYDIARDKYSRLISKSSSYVIYMRSAYNCNNDPGDEPCMSVKTGHRRCQCQKQFDGRSKIKENCDPYKLFRSIPDTYTGKKNEENFRLWCKDNKYDWGSVGDWYVHSDNRASLPVEHSRWPAYEPDYRGKIEAVKARKPVPPSTINFSCQQCSTDLDIGDIETSPVSDISQYLNCVLEVQQNENINSTNSNNSNSGNTKNVNTNSKNSNSGNTKNVNTNSKNSILGNTKNVNTNSDSNSEENSNSNSNSLNTPLIIGGLTICAFGLAFWFSGKNNNVGNSMQFRQPRQF